MPASSFSPDIVRYVFGLALHQVPMIGGSLGAKDRQFRSEPMFEMRDRDFVDGPAAGSQDVESGVEGLADLKDQHVEIACSFGTPTRRARGA